MNRREFLTLSLVGGVSLLIPNLVTTGPKFYPQDEYGRAMPYTGKYSAISAIALAILHKDAKATLPRGTYYEIRGTIPKWYGIDKGLAWYRAPNMKRNFTQKLTLAPNGGYVYISGHYA